MSVTLAIRFPAGRYHATPWGRHVNEGGAEWPPSPWRLLRAFVAVWRRKCPEIPEASVREALEFLTAPPVFHLPPHRVAHTRHFMPWEKKGPLDRTLVLDTFVAIDRSERLLMRWDDVDPPADALATLGKLAANLAFLGRAEGWVEVELTQEPFVPNCVPAGGDADDAVDVFCVTPESVFAGDKVPTPDAKKLRKGLQPRERTFDAPRWHLCLDTETIHDERWPEVPGARWVKYAVAPAAESRPSRAASMSQRYQVATFLLDAPVLPLVTSALSIAERVRCATMSQFQNWCRENREVADRFRIPESTDSYASVTLSGKDEQGSLVYGHNHAHYIPCATADDPHHLRYVHILARSSYLPEEVESFGRLRFLRGSDESELHIRLTGLSDLVTARQSIPFLRTSDVWVSDTPFVGPAHIGSRGRVRYLRKAIGREWRRLAEQIPEYSGVTLTRIEELEAGDRRLEGRPEAWKYLVVRRKHRHEGESRVRGMFVLEFSRAIPGPVCIGYGSHFGMGRFVPPVSR